MKQIALNIWDDLREKRLWPVALVLLLALIAVPVVLMQPADAPAPPAARPQPNQAQSTPAVVVDDASRESSRLGVFGKKDPFRPPASTLKPSTSTARASSGAPAGASVASPTSGPAPTSPGSTAAPIGSSGGTGATGGSTPAPVQPRTRSPRAYTYVVDVRFGREGKTRLRRGIQRTAVLPTERNPVAVFLGVSADKRAVFLLNSALRQSGEGACRPSRATCSFLYLTTAADRDTHRIVNSRGVTYVLKLEAIRRVSVRQARRASARARARARKSSKSAAVAFPILADEQR